MADQGEVRELMVWVGTPGISAADAFKSLNDDTAVRESPKVRELEEWARAIDGVQVNRIALRGGARDIVILTVSARRLGEIGPQVRAECVRREMILLDATESILVVPAEPGSADWPRSTMESHPEGIRARLARQAESAADQVLVPRTPEEAREILKRGGSVALDLSKMRPRTIDLPFPSPWSLDFATVYVPPPRRGQLETVLKQLSSGSAIGRRDAATRLGSWPPSSLADEALGTRARLDDDDLVRAKASLSLAVRRSVDAQFTLDLATNLIESAAHSNTGNKHEEGRWIGLAASIATLAAAVAVALDHSPESEARLQALLERLASITTERERAQDIRASFLNRHPMPAVN